MSPAATAGGMRSRNAPLLPAVVSSPAAAPAGSARGEVLSRPPLQRMMRLHQLIATGDYPNARTLAEALEVSRKTIGRDLDFMRDRLGYPIAYDPLRYGFYYTQAVTEFPVMEVSEGEVAALLIAQKALAQHRGHAFAQPLRHACDKLLESLGGKMSVRVAELEAAISFRTTGASEVEPEIFAAVSEATLRSVAFTFRYQKLSVAQVESRRVQPYHLGCVENQWYCFGYCLDREQVRTFALPRMSAVTLGQDRFQVPADFAIADYLRESFGVFAHDDGKRPLGVRLLFDAWAGQLIRERLWHPSQVLKPQAGGGTLLKLQLGGLEEILPWVLSWGAHVRVLAPKALRERVMAEARAVLAGA